MNGGQPRTTELSCRRLVKGPEPWPYPADPALTISCAVSLPPPLQSFLHLISRMSHPACDSPAVGLTCAELMALSPVLAEGWACADQSGQSVDCSGRSPWFWASSVPGSGHPLAKRGVEAGSRKNLQPSARTDVRSNV